MKLSKEEIEKRIDELTGKLKNLVQKPKRFQQFKHDEEIARMEGEIFGLRWVLLFWDNGYYETERMEQVSENNA